MNQDTEISQIKLKISDYELQILDYKERVLKLDKALVDKNVEYAKLEADFQSEGYKVKIENESLKK